DATITSRPETAMSVVLMWGSTHTIDSSCCRIRLFVGLIMANLQTSPTASRVVPTLFVSRNARSRPASQICLPVGPENLASCPPADLSPPALFILPEPLVEVGCPCLALPILCRGAAERQGQRPHRG